LRTVSPDESPERPSGFWASIREALSGSERDYTRGSLNRAVALLAIPMVLEMAGESAFAVADAFFVARLGVEALAAVGLTESVLEIIYAIAIGLSMSTTAMVARRFGEKNERAAARTAVQAIAVGIATSIILGAAGVIWAPQLLRMMGATPETVEIGTTYTRVMYGTMGVIVLLHLNNAIYRGAGDAAMAMRSVWLANGINIVLDPLLIFGLGPFPELGLTGAAVATTIGRGMGVAYQFWGLSRGRRLRVRGSDVRLDLRIVRRLLRISGGGVGQLLVSQASYIGLIRILAGFGTAVLAGYVVAIRVVIFIIMPAWGLSNAAATLVGQNLGARKPKRAERAVYVTGAWNMLFMTVITVLFVTFASQIIAPFVADPESHAAGTSALRIISYGYVFYAWGMVMLQAFNGAGDTATPTKLNFVIFWLFQLPLAWMLARTLGLGPVGVYWAIAIAYSLSAVIGILLFRRGRWKEKEV
jgi:putative MATE family efflux protein